MIPDAVIRQIQDRLDIVEVVGNYLPLRRAGRNFKGCCPFHLEKTPSMMVSPDKQIYHCFGCGAGGNVIGFVMKFEKKDFREAIEALADQVGIEIPKDKPVNPAQEERTQLFVKANTLAADFYNSFLSKKEAEKAAVYLNKRGLDAETIKSFKLGYAPEAWDAFYSFAKSQVPEAILEKAGLIIARKDASGFYDRFRGRVMFPILDARGICIAFGGRVMDDSVPKYMNSPETEIYSKGRNLYGMFQAKTAIRDDDFAMVVEGYMDLIACHQAGVKNVVASLGTALTSDQARLIRRYTKNVFILYDADKAGESATLRGLEIFLEEGMEVKIVRLPDGHDPDSFIQQFGVAHFKEAVSQAKNLFEYKLALLKTQFDAKTSEGRVKIANDLVSLFSKVQNEIQKSAWIRELAEELSISEQALTLEMQKSRNTGRTETAQKPSPRKISSTEIAPLEKLLLGLALDSEEFAVVLRNEVDLSDFENQVSKRIMSQFLETAPSRSLAGELMNFFREDTEAVELISKVSADVEVLADKRKVFSDCVVQMRRQRIRHEREELMSQMTMADRAGDMNRVNEFMMQLNELNKKEKKINEKK